MAPITINALLKVSPSAQCSSIFGRKIFPPDNGSVLNQNFCYNKALLLGPIPITAMLEMCLIHIRGWLDPSGGQIILQLRACAHKREQKWVYPIYQTNIARSDLLMRYLYPWEQKALSELENFSLLEVKPLPSRLKTSSLTSIFKPILAEEIGNIGRSLNRSHIQIYDDMFYLGIDTKIVLWKMRPQEDCRSFV